MRHTLLTNFRVPAEPKCEVKPFPFEFVTAAATTAVNVAPSIFFTEVLLLYVNVYDKGGVRGVHRGLTCPP